MNEVTITIGGDTVPTQRDVELFLNGDAEGLFGGLYAEIQSSDIFVLNLECPLVDSASPILKVGPNLKAPMECVQGLKIANAVNLANNHIMDYGQKGLFSTIENCRQNGIDCIGAGENSHQAGTLWVRKVNGIRIGILGVAENEFSIASESTPGAYGLDVMEIVGKLQSYRDQVDFCIILYHGGNEHYPYPSPRLQKLSRFLVDQGADSIICQHSHCPGCYEIYQDKLIVYGQGNLIFDRPSHRDKPWMQGFLVQLKVSAEKSLSHTLIPYVQLQNMPGIQLLTNQHAETFLSEINKRSGEILQNGFVDYQWRLYCERMKDQYLSLMFLPQYRLLNIANRWLQLIQRFFSQKRMSLLLNLIRCESHRDVLLNILKKRKSEDNNEEI